LRRNIHFISSYVCIKNFLKIYDNSLCNTIIVHEDKIELQKFLDTILNDKKVEFITVKRHLLINYLFLKNKKSLKKFIIVKFRDLNLEDTIYFYSDMFTIDYFLIINYLKKKCKVEFVDSEPKLLIKKNLSFKFIILKIVVFILSLMYSISLKIIDTGMYTLIWVHKLNANNNYFSSNEFNKINLFDAKLMFPNSKEEKKVLYIHQYLNDDSINYQKTIKNLIKFFISMKDKNISVFFKNHPDNKEDISTILSVIDNDKIVPSWIPTEFIEDIFDQYYTFYSLGINEFSKNKSYSLYNFIIFYEQDSYIKKFIEDNMKNISFLDSF